MTIEEAKEAIKDIPIGSRIQLLKRDGSVIDVNLSSYDISSIPEKKHRTVTVPEMPAALIVNGRMRFGNYRVEIEDILNIAWVDNEKSHLRE